LPEDDPKQRQPNIDLAEKLLGWHPTINLTEGLKRTVAISKRFCASTVRQLPATSGYNLRPLPDR